MNGKYPMTGMNHRGTEELVTTKIPVGHAMKLVREPDNKFDKNAVKVIFGDQHVAYVKAYAAKDLAMAMDSAGVAEIEGAFSFNTYPCVIVDAKPAKEPTDGAK